MTAQATDKQTTEPSLIVFGRDEGGRPHASWFTASEVELAERAAGFMGMWALHVPTDQHRAATSELAAGKIFSSGKVSCPFCKEGAYERLEAFGEALQPLAPIEPEAPVHTSVPDRCVDIAVGALVLATEGVHQSYYEAVVVASADAIASALAAYRH